MQPSWVIGAPVLLLLVAVVPAYATQWSASYLLKFKPRFLGLVVLTIGALLIASLANAGYNNLSPRHIGQNNDSHAASAIFFFIVQVILFAKFLRHPEIGPIGYANALKVAALAMLIETVALFLLAFVFMGLFNAFH